MTPTTKKKAAPKKVASAPKAKAAKATLKAPLKKVVAPQKAKEKEAPLVEKSIEVKKETPKVQESKPAPQKERASSSNAIDAAASKLKGIRIRLSAFDHTVIDEAAMKIVDTALRSGAVVHGPTPLPTKIKKFTVNRSTFVHKDARDQFEMRTHRRLIDLSETTFKTVDALQNLSLPSGVDIEIRMG